MNDNFERAAEDSPDRCQAVTRDQGQCRLKALEGSKYCVMHGGPQEQQRTEQASLNNYRLAVARLQQQLVEKSNSTGIKSLRDEIAILRIVMQERLDRCTDSTELLLQSQQISDLAVKIEKLVSSCHKLEGSMKQLVDKQALLEFASGVISVITSHVDNQEVLSDISNDIMKLLAGGED